MLKIDEKEFKFYASRYIPSVLGIYEKEEPKIRRIYTKEFRAAKQGFEKIKTLVIKLSLLENIVNSEDKKFTSKHILLIGNKHIMDSALNNDEIKIRSFFNEIRSRQVCVRKNNSPNKVNTNLEFLNCNPPTEENFIFSFPYNFIIPDVKRRRKSFSSEIIQESQDKKARLGSISRESPQNNFLLPLKYISNAKKRYSSIESVNFGLNMKSRFYSPSLRKLNGASDSLSITHISQKSKNENSEVHSTQKKLNLQSIIEKP